MNWELFTSSPTADRVAAMLLHSLWQGALLALGAAAVCRVGRRLTVASHYLIYATALGGCAAALPVTYWLLGSEGPRPQVAASVESPGDSAPFAAVPLATAETSSAPTSDAVPQPFLEPSLRPTPSIQPVAIARSRSIDATWRQAIPWLLATYAVGVFVMLLRLVIGVIGAERLRAAARPIAEGSVGRALELARRRWPLQRTPIVGYSEQVVVPALVGLLKPTILLPASATVGLTPQELELVLAHELAHAVRRDLWVTLFQRIIEAVLFFNPAVWYLSRRASTLREFCCDEAACGAVAVPSAAVRIDYATALLRMAELARPALRGEPRVLALAAAGSSPSEFRRRIARLLGEPVREPLRASRSGLAAALASIVLAAGVVWAESDEKPAEAATKHAGETSETSGESNSTATKSEESPEELAARLTKLLPPRTDADRIVANARARTFGLAAVGQISIRDRSWNGTITESFQPHDGSLASLWAARGKQVDERMRRNTDSTVTVAWSGPQLLVQSDNHWNVDAATPSGLYTQSRYWDGTDGWWSEGTPAERHIYQYAAVDQLMEGLIPSRYTFWEGAGGRLPWNRGAVVFEEHEVAPELTRYQLEGTETIDGVVCDAYAGPARQERIWIEQATGLVKAVSRQYLLKSTPNYFTELVTEAAGRTFRDAREYFEWFKQQPANIQELLSSHMNAASWSLTTPGNLTIFNHYRELLPGVEFPMRAERIVVHPNDGGAGFKYYRSEAEITDTTEKFDIRKLAAPALPRVGDVVTDRRAEPPVDYTWSSDKEAVKTEIATKHDELVSQLRAEEEKNELINSRPINSVADAIEVLTEGPKVEPTKVWARAIKYLVDNKEEAFPAVVAALDAEERDHPLSKLAFTLRAMNDPRAIPVLIRAFPKTLLPGRSDFVLRLDGQGSDHDELMQFMAMHDLDVGDGGEIFGYGRAFREVAETLRKLTGQDFGEMELNFIKLAKTPKQFVLQQRQFDRVAQRWANWWEANWQAMTDDKAYASVNLPPSMNGRVPPVGANELPSGANIRLSGGASGSIIASPQEDPHKRCLIDLDTGRKAGWPASLPPFEEIGVDSPELLAWAEAEGFDLMGFTYTPPGEAEPLYCLKPLGMQAWKITPAELRALKKRAPGRREYPLSQPVDVMIPRREILPPFDHAVDGDSFLYLTREGTAGVVRMTAQVPKKNPMGGAYGEDDDFMPTGLFPGAKVNFEVFK